MESLQSTPSNKNLPPGLTGGEREPSSQKRRKTPIETSDIDTTTESPKALPDIEKPATEIIRVFRDSTLERGYRAFNRWLEQNDNNPEASFPQSFNLFVAEFERSEKLKDSPEFHDLIRRMGEWKARMAIRQIELEQEQVAAAKEQARQERLAMEGEELEAKFDHAIDTLRAIDAGRENIMLLVKDLMEMFAESDIKTIKKIQERIAIQAVKEDEHNKNRPWYKKLSFTDKKSEANNLFRLWSEAMNIVNEKMKEAPRRKSSKK